jgi:NAD kinase
MPLFKKAQQAPPQRQRQAQATQRASSSVSEGWVDIEKIVIVTKRTPLEDLVLRLNSKSQARFYLEQNQVSFSEYEKGDAQYQHSVEAIKQQLPRDVKHQFIDRSLLPTYQFGAHDLVVTVGPDGLVINTAKYLTNQPILAINPDPARIDGVLIPFRFEELGTWVARALRGEVAVKRVSMAKATLNDGQTLYSVNDLFIGPRTHGSARYLLEFDGQQETQSTSGIIVSTGAGCTGWLRSITTGAWHIARHFSPVASDAPTVEQIMLGWESETLWFVVREPFLSKTSQASIVFGQITPGQELVITSHMPDYGVIFSDGIESDYLAFNSGFIARVGLA